ncbi:phage portal protein [Ochrobactrum sp. Sa2BUA5]|nr:phage portal protein [Ochrobactrum gallinarum]
MGFMDWWRGSDGPPKRRGAPKQQWSSMADTPLNDFIQNGDTSTSRNITAENSMKIAAVWRCVNLISGTVATLPLDLKRRVDSKTRIDADDHALWSLLRRKPNRWQTPSEFRRMMQASVLLRGNGYAYKVYSRGEVIELIPLNADNVEVKQERDLSLTYNVTLPSGSRLQLKQKDMLHLRGMTFDGIVGLPVLTYAREAMGLSLSTEQHATSLFENGTNVGGVLRHEGKLGIEGQEALRESLEYYRRGGAREGRDLILEEGMTYDKIGMTSNDAQFIQTRVQSLTEIAMFFGVPPHMLGITEKSTSWGSGIEQQNIGFITYTVNDWLVMWEQAIGRDLIPEDDFEIYAKFNIAGLLKGDMKARFDSYAIGRNWGWLSVNDIRASEDMNPIDGGDEYLQPLNMQPVGIEPTTVEAPSQE